MTSLPGAVVLVTGANGALSLDVTDPASIAAAAAAATEVTVVINNAGATTKAAFWSFTNTLPLELQGQGTRWSVCASARPTPR